jgi:Resolvase, N terminal domain
VSTERQGSSGLGLEAQQKAVRDYLNGGAWELVGEFVEVESGKRADRPDLAKALEACKRHKARLVIAKLDRLSRSKARRFVAYYRVSTERPGEASRRCTTIRGQCFACNPAASLGGL